MNETAYSENKYLKLRPKDDCFMLKYKINDQQDKFKMIVKAKLHFDEDSTHH